MDSRPEKVLPGFAIEAPAGECARRFLDVLLGVAAFAEREELHDLARKVLVRLAFAVLRAVQVHEHCRVLGCSMQQRAEVAEGVGAQHRVLAVHEPRDPHLLLARHEMVVPEKRHPLRQRRRRDEHLLHPPCAQLEAAPDLILRKRLALVLRRAGSRPPQRAAIQCKGRRWRDGCRACLAQQARHRVVAGQCGVQPHFGVRRPESRAREQMPRVVVAHRRRGGVRPRRHRGQRRQQGETRGGER